MPALNCNFAWRLRVQRTVAHCLLLVKLLQLTSEQEILSYVMKIPVNVLSWRAGIAGLAQAFVDLIVKNSHALPFK